MRAQESRHELRRRYTRSLHRFIHLLDRSRIVRGPIGPSDAIAVRLGFLSWIERQAKKLLHLAEFAHHFVERKLCWRPREFILSQLPLLGPPQQVATIEVRQLVADHTHDRCLTTGLFEHFARNN